MYLTHQNLNDYYALDIETDGLSPTVIHCVVIQNLGTNQTWEILSRGGFTEFLERERPRYWVAHNGIAFDIPVLNRIYGTDISITSCVDTLVLSYLYHPTMPEGHSLESWGTRLGLPKSGLDISDWSVYTPDMLVRCLGDVSITGLLFKRLTKRMKARGFSEKSCEIEHKIQHVISKQRQNGFRFDQARAVQLHSELLRSQGTLGEDIHKLFPPELSLQATYKQRVKGDGTPYAQFAKHLGRFAEVRVDYEEPGTYSCFDWTEFNIGSPLQRTEKLIQLGFKPTKFTPKGRPKVDEETLLEFAQQSKIAEVGAIAEWIVLQGRSTMIQGWLNTFNPSSSCIHGIVFPCGAASRRMVHSQPNTANIPTNSVKYGKECRELWVARPGRVLLGYDAAALEMRMFCHYMNSEAVSALYLTGDPHQANTEALRGNPWNLEVTRPKTKNGFYAFLYGAQDPKLGATLHPNGGRDFGKWARERLYEGTPGLERFVKEATDEYNGSPDHRLLCVDGGFVVCPSPHAVVNYKFQSAGGITMKLASVLLDEAATRAGVDHLKVGDIHDEGQHDVVPGDAEELGRLAIQAIADAGESLNLHLPLTGSYKIGNNWSETH